MKARTMFAVLVFFVMAISANVSALDFVLTSNQHLNVETEYSIGSLFDSSTADVRQGGYVPNVYIYDNAALQVFEYRYGTYGMSIGRTRVFGDGQIIVSGGATGSIVAEENSRVTVIGGETGDILALGNSHIELSGGVIPNLNIGGNSALNIFAQNFILGSGLWLDGNRLLGTGTLSGQWLDSTHWTTQISGNSQTATIMLIPEPATMLLLAAGCLLMRRTLSKRREQ